MWRGELTMLSHPTVTVGSDSENTVVADGGNIDSTSTVDHSGPHLTVTVDVDA